MAAAEVAYIGALVPLIVAPPVDTAEMERLLFEIVTPEQKKAIVESVYQGAGQAATHARGRGGGVVQPGYHDQGQHPGEAAAVGIAQGEGVRVIQSNLGGRHGARTQLVLEPMQAYAWCGRVGRGGEPGERGVRRVARDEERRQALAAVDAGVRPDQRHRHRPDDGPR